VLAAVAAGMWTQTSDLIGRSHIKRRLSAKCWLLGHEDCIRRSARRLYLECLDCGRETQGWTTGRT